MAGTFGLGEQKVRPGAYFNIRKNGGDAAAEVVNGVTAVLFRADYGPLCTAAELSAEDGYEAVFGNGMTTDAIREAFAGGAKTVIACRVGSGGTQSDVSLNDENGEKALSITAKYSGEKGFTVTIREKLTDNTKRQCIIYSGTSEFEKVEFEAGSGEAVALVQAFRNSSNFTARIEPGKEDAVLANISQSVFQAGTNPTAAAKDYSDALAQVEPYEFNTICVDTEDTSIHLLLASFVNRIFDTGSLVQAVVAEKHTVALDTRMAHAAAFNDEKISYVLNAHINEQGTQIDGYQTAARIAGLIGACNSGSSLTHTVINGFTELSERLTNTQVIAAEKSGCLVLTGNSAKQIWIDNAINTLITPSDNQDAGWKKIRRVKTRFELIRRLNITADYLVGKIDNDNNGRATVISQLQSVCDAMVSENKLISCKVSESGTYKADGDSAWFDIAVVDKDSMEHIYLSFLFQFSTNV